MFRFRICIIWISNLPKCFSFVKRLCPSGSIFFILDGKSCHFIIIIIITCRKGNEPDSSKSISTLCKGCISNHESILNRGKLYHLKKTLNFGEQMGSCPVLCTASNHNRVVTCSPSRDANLWESLTTFPGREIARPAYPIQLGMFFPVLKTDF